MRRAWVVVSMLGACGRIGFDATTDDGPGGPGTCADIPGLVARWSMDSDDIVNGQVLDSVGGHHGTITTTAGTPAESGMGKHAQALDFRMATQSYVIVPSLTFPTAPGAAITVSMWFHRKGEPLSEVLVYVPSTPRVDFWLQDNWTCFNTGNSDCWGSSTIDVYDTWVHATAVFKNGLISDSKMYIAGVRVTETCVSLPQYPCDTPSLLGGPFILGGDDVYPFHGRMDEVRLFDRELTPAEIELLRDGGACNQ